MKSIKRSKANAVRIPFTVKARKKYPFRTPIPPCSVVRVKTSPPGDWRKNVGRPFRIGYYSKMDGLDSVWLVNEQGKYEQTIDHEFLQKYFLIETVSKERSFYGRNRPQFGPIE